MTWVNACAADAIGEDSGLRLDHDGRTFAIFRNDQHEYFCTDGLCTHENIHLADGLVMGNTVSCPKHSSIFDFSNGEVDTPPACEDLATYSIKVENGRIWVDL